MKLFPAPRHHPRARRGILLIELIGYLSIMAALSLLATEMVVTSLRTYKETTTRDTMIHRVDTAMAALRQDVWCAQALTATGEELAIVQSDGVVRWRQESGGKLTRFTAIELPLKRTWIDMPRFTFTVKGATLHVDVAAPGAPDEKATLVSQPILAGDQK